MITLIKRIKAGTYYGIVIIMIGMLMACPLLILPFYHNEIKYAPAFLLPASISVLIGSVICILRPYHKFKGNRWQPLIKEGSVPVLFVWLYAFFAGSVPFIMISDMSFTLSLFESVSGWTTTGLTVVDVSKLPHLLLLHRSFMQYCGGLGFVIMITTISGNPETMSLYNAEGHPDQLKPSLRGTARIIAKLYLGGLVLGIAAYCIAGMPPFEAICHTMSALSTAGFSTNTTSMAAYNNSAINIITIVLMLVGASNFYIVFLTARGKIGTVLRESEVKFMAGLTISFSLLAACNLYAEGKGSIGHCLMNGTFGVITTFTTTGYSLEKYAVWPAFSLGLLALLMIIGGSAGSTAGGIKLLRACLLLRITIDDLKQHLTPDRSVTSLTYRKHQTNLYISKRIKENTIGFVIVYMLTLTAGILLITLTSDCSLSTAAFEFASALGTVGISNGLTGPHTNPATLYIEMFGMFLGRLEIIMVFVGLSTCVNQAGRFIFGQFR
ncbi:MAG: TrkH family potassium uptake protein [Clostridia bacterium]|nr:TrkH family potassium uptake protein [Clostridia bacterium]